MEHNLLEAADLAVVAVRFDKSNCTDAAIYYYKEAARLINEAADQYNGSDFEVWLKKANEYSERADNLSKPRSVCVVEVPRPEVLKLNRCKFLFSHALDADEAEEKESAIRLYTEAIELCLSAKSETQDPSIQAILLSLAKQALERAEELKGVAREQVTESSFDPRSVRPGLSRQVSVGHSDKPQLHRGSSGHLIVCGNPSLSFEEKRVLLATSRINGIDYVPFMDIDLKEKFQYAIPFTDKDGPLALSPKQKKEFNRWARPEEFSKEPKMILNEHTDCYSIKQTIISDCSFVASLAVSALYEKRFNKRLITSIIYPKNRQKQPIYNPFGKYMIKLHLNGVPRKVIIDDTLPLGRYNELLCSFSTNKCEMWISLLEKGYMKVMGGYDFPGSNSNIDLHALTGWIPERQSIRPNDADFNAESLFNLLFTRIHNGDLLVTVATGDLSEVEANRAGLIPTHAYAVLDIRLINDLKLFKLKNPWSHVRWKGNFSELDKVHWTPSLQGALNYDPKSAEMFDNGVFWIDYSSLLKFFDVFYMNWNPELFTYTSCIHQSWSAGVGPVKDNYNIGDNPQFSLSVDSQTKGSVWILLTRHITSIEDFKNNSEYITLLVYKNNGNRVYYPNDPPPYLDGVRINSPHYLTKIILTDTSPNKFTLVVSQFEKTTTIYYTLRAYSTCKFTMNKIADLYKHKIEMKDGSWQRETAGGCKNYPQTYSKNPCYRITVSSDCCLLIDLKAPKQFYIGLMLQSVTQPDFQPRTTAPYRAGFVILETTLPSGTYDVVPSTFEPGQESPFFLTFKSSCPINVIRIK